METTILILVITTIVVGILLFLVAMTFLVNLQTQVIGLRKIQELYYESSIEQFQLIKFIELIKLREVCIHREEFEKAQRIDEILKEFPDFFTTIHQSVAPTEKRSDL